MAATAAAWAGRPLVAADLRHEGNAFTALRWLLASSVMLSHAWDLTQTEAGHDPSVRVLGVTVSWLAVSLFFTLSGFLVTGSLVKRGAGEFALARALRLLPGLWVMLGVVTLGLWLIFGTTTFAAYLGDPLTLRYVVRNALTLGGEYRLPGMFDGQPVTAVNGSLWTIPQEVRCYIVLGVLGAAGLLASRRVLALGFVAGLAVHLALPLDLVPALTEPRRLAVSFFLGVVAYQWRDRLRLSWPLALAGAAAALVIVHSGAPESLAHAALQLGFAYLTLVAAFALPAALTGGKRAAARLQLWDLHLRLSGPAARRGAWDRHDAAGQSDSGTGADATVRGAVVASRREARARPQAAAASPHTQRSVGVAYTFDIFPSGELSGINGLSIKIEVARLLHIGYREM